MLEKEGREIASELSWFTSASGILSMDEAPVSLSALKGAAERTGIIILISGVKRSSLLRRTVFSCSLIDFYLGFTPSFVNETESFTPPESVLMKEIDSTIWLKSAPIGDWLVNSTKRLPLMDFASEDTLPEKANFAVPTSRVYTRNGCSFHNR